MNDNLVLRIYLAVTFLLSLLGVSFLVVLALRLRNEQIKKERMHQQAMLMRQELTLQKAAQEVHDACKPLVAIIAMNLKVLDREVAEAQRGRVAKCLEVVALLSSEMQLGCSIMDGRHDGALGLMSSMSRIVKWVNDLRPLKCVMSVDGTGRCLIP